MTDACYEIVLYHCADADQADQQRRVAQAQARVLPGFQSWLPLCGADDARMRADLVIWDSLASAEQAAGVVAQAPEFAPFRDGITAMTAMGHYHAGRALSQDAQGIELGRFRLKPGTDEAQMRAAYDRMVARHLSQLPGWRGQQLIRLQDGSFVDLALADSQDRAMAICETWHGNADCQAFLALIDPISMEFGRAI